MDDQNQQRRRDLTIAFIVTFCVILVIVAFVLLMLGPARGTGSAGKDDTQAMSLEAISPFYVLLIGSDSLKGTALYTEVNNRAGDVEQADAITLVRVDPATHMLTFLSIPRDTVLDGQYSKLCETLIGGDVQKTVDAVQTLTGVHISYSMKTTFSSFEDLIGGIGGVTVDVPVKVTVKDPLTAKNVTVKAGDDQLLYGSKALVFSRALAEYGADGDALRQTNVRSVEVAMLEKAASNDDDGIREALSFLQQDTETDMPDSLIVSLALDYAANRELVVVHSGSGPYNGYNRASDGAFVVPEDTVAWQQVMSAVSAGEDPTTVIALPAF